MKRKHLVAAGTIAFLLTFIAQAPAGALYAWLAPKAAKVELFGVDGTLLHGSVAGIGVQGRPAWQELHWTLHPLGLLTARVLADFETSTPAVVRGRVSLAPWGTSLGDVRASGSARTLFSAVGQGFLPIEGQVSADLQSLRLKDGKAASVEGVINVEGLSWTLAKDPIVLGNFRGTATTDAGKITLKIESISGPIDASGNVDVDADQAYNVDLKIKVKPGSPPMVQNLVQSLGAPDAQGFYHVLRKGKLT
ncbi:MAG TPA: type II secretion system protein N [Nevskiaceae bacterium]|nr:type II secretion system protein N [Nevskiaceae bacterium]